MPVPLNYLDAIFPYGGGTDNPGDDTSKAGGPATPAAVETAPFQPIPRVTGDSVRNPLGPLTPPLPHGISQQGVDTILPQTMQAVPPDGALLEAKQEYGGLDAADPEGTDPIYGTPRESGQDETVGETETTSGTSPAAFPEPNP